MVESTAIGKLEQVTQAPHPPKSSPLFNILMRLCAVKRQEVDLGHLSATLAAEDGPSDQPARLHWALAQMNLMPAKAQSEPSREQCPLLAFFDNQWMLILGFDDARGWVTQSVASDGSYNDQAQTELPKTAQIWKVDLRPHRVGSQSPSLRMIMGQVLKERKMFFEIMLAGLILMGIAVSVSLFSMQVYDRVIPAGAIGTLTVLVSGVAVALVIELSLRFARSGVVERLTDRVDQSLARSIMSRFLSIRLDHMPQSVGQATQTIRGYETVRGFLVASLSTLMVDLPVSLFLMFVVWMIGGPVVYVPLAFFVLGILLAIRNKHRSEVLAKMVQDAHSRKAGLMVEAVEAAETMKANAASWRLLARWLNITDEARGVDEKYRHVSEDSQFILMFFHQFSYAMTVTVGALLVIEGQMTFGGLIGCSILTGRILTPVGQIPNLVTQWASAKMALKALDAYWQLEQETADGSGAYAQALRPSIEVKDLRTPCHGQGSLILDLPQLSISAGERVAIIGPVGTGKTSLLRHLAGLNRPAEGAVFLGDYDTRVLSRSTIAANIGYVHQDGRLLSGSLRDNMVLGVPDPGEERILEVSRQFGAYDLIIKPAQLGLDLPITESGSGLSGGQKQLVQIVRAVLKDPAFFMLDEPTASLDQQAEMLVMNGLADLLRQDPEKSLVFVTHKPKLLSLVDRIIVMGGGRIVLDGPRDDVIKRLAIPTKPERQA